MYEKNFFSFPLFFFIQVNSNWAPMLLTEEKFTLTNSKNKTILSILNELYFNISFNSVTAMCTLGHINNYTNTILQTKSHKVPCS